MNTAWIVALIGFIGFGISLTLFFMSKFEIRSLSREIEILDTAKQSLERINDELLTTNTAAGEQFAALTQTSSDLKDLNTDLESLTRESHNFVLKVHEILSADLGFLQGELATKLSLDIPEVRSLHQGLQRLKEDISAIKDVIEESERIKNE